MRSFKIIKTTLLVSWCFFSVQSFAQCSDCGNGAVDTGETTANCPADVAHSATCTSPCAQSGSFESTVGIRQAHDFIGTTTWSTVGLPAGWAFAGAPTATTAGALPAADAYGAKAGLIHPNCSGSCIGTNGFCIGNLANISAVGGGGSLGKLGANFDGRANVSQNLSYAVLRGQGNRTLVSETYNVSAVDGFKVQFWLFPSETSCGQSNSWGSCVGNVAYLDFSSNGGTSWTQVLQMDLSSSNNDMCTNNTSNTLWLNGSAWSRVCLTVFKSISSPGNFYTAASSTTAASGIMVNSAYFTANFKYRIRYSQTASCTSGITTTNPGRYLAIDYPVMTSGNEMIPCGISFAQMCGFGEDNNDDGVGSTSTALTTVFGTVRRSPNQSERGVEIFNSQDASFANQNLSGSNLTTNFDLCNPEGGDKQCIDWQSNNNFYFAVYECVTDWEAPTGSTGINLNYYKGTTPQSFGLTKVTAVGKTASIGWRYSGSRFVSCGATSDLNPGCNGYLFRSASLPLQFSRGFYSLAVNSSGQSWSYYGATSCSNYFSGPVFSPIAIPEEVAAVTNYVVCDGSDLVFSADARYCSTSDFTGSATIEITGPGGFSETITAGGTGLTPITVPGEYTLTAQTPATPVQCLDCGRSVCVDVSQLEIDNCLVPLASELINFESVLGKRNVGLLWETATEKDSDRFDIERSEDGKNYIKIGNVKAQGNSEQSQWYDFLDSNPVATAYYRLAMVDTDGTVAFSKVISVAVQFSEIQIIPNPSDGNFQIIGLEGNSSIEVIDIQGSSVYNQTTLNAVENFDLNLKSGVYIVRITNELETQTVRMVID